MSKASEGAARTWVLILTATASFMVALDALVVTTAGAADGLCLPGRSTAAVPDRVPIRLNRNAV